MSLIRKHGAVLQAWACLDLVYFIKSFTNIDSTEIDSILPFLTYPSTIVRNACIAFLQPKPFLNPNWFSDDVNNDKKQYSKTLDLNVRSNPYWNAARPFKRRNTILFLLLFLS